MNRRDLFAGVRRLCRRVSKHFPPLDEPDGPPMDAETAEAILHAACCESFAVPAKFAETVFPGGLSEWDRDDGDPAAEIRARWAYTRMERAAAAGRKAEELAVIRAETEEPTYLSEGASA